MGRRAGECVRLLLAALRSRATHVINIAQADRNPGLARACRLNVATQMGSVRRSFFQCDHGEILLWVMRLVNRCLNCAVVSQCFHPGGT